MKKSLPTLMAIAIAASAMVAPLTAFSFPPRPVMDRCDKSKENPHCAGRLVTIGKLTSSEVQTAPPDEVLNLRLTPPIPAREGSATPVPAQPTQNATPHR